MKLGVHISVAKIINTADLKPDSLSDLDNHNVYCGLDSCVTHEVQGKIHSQLDEETRIIYNFELALQAPVLEMMLRGLLTDPYEVSRLLSIYERRRERINSIIQHYASVVWGGPLNPASPKQLIKFFYETMNVPKVYIFDKEKKRLSTNREALEKVQQYRYSRPIATAVLAFRDMSKKIGVLKNGVDDDGRMRFSYNIAGTNTGRFSCNKNVKGGGTNAQNITDELRRIFIADEGKKFAYLDLEQAESRFVAYISGDEAYIEACESADLHVSVAKDIWPELDWSGGDNYNPAADKETAEQKFWRHWSYRDLSKRGGHLTNYVGQPISNAKNLHISVEVMRHFQRTYLGKFSGIKRMFTDVARELQTTSIITTPLGRKRLFFGRNYEDDILRKGVAYRPQSGVGDLLNLGMWKVWKHMRPDVDLLGQLHDAILIQYDDDPTVERRVIATAIDLMTIPITVTDIRLRGALTREMTIPVDVSVGWNWAKVDRKDAKKNPDGLLSYKGEDKRRRLVSPSMELLKRTM